MGRNQIVQRIPIVIDGGSPREGMLDMARLSDCFIASETFSRSISHDPRDTCFRLSELGCPFVGVTLGSRGYMAWIEGRWIVKAAYPAKTIDTTGCGDVFHAGVAYGILQGWDREACLDLGAWAAASVSEHMGGRKGIPSRRQLEERYGRSSLMNSKRSIPS
jgi:ribokinase